MEGLLVFLMIICLYTGWLLRKKEREKQIDENMEGTYRQETKKRRLKLMDRYAYQLNRAGFPIPRPLVPYVMFSFSIFLGFLVSIKMDQTGFVLGLLMGPFFLNRLLAFIMNRNEKKFIRDFELSLDVGASIIRAHGKLEDVVEESLKIVEIGWFYREMKRIKERLIQTIPIVQAFEEMAERVQLEAVDYAAQALKSTSGQGANYAVVFDDIRMMINRSAGAEKKALSKTTELRRMAYILVSLPFLVGILFKDSLLNVIRAQPNILFIILGVLALNLVGTWFIWKAVKIRV